MIRKCLYVLEHELMYGLCDRNKTLPVYPGDWPNILGYEESQITEMIEWRLIREWYQL